MDNASEALAIYKALEPMISALIDRKTKSCDRSEKMTVTTAPANNVIGVSRAYGNEIFIPYVSSLSSVAVGTSVRVRYYSNDASTMIAVSLGNGK